jgi:putative two-component system response regulator
MNDTMVILAVDDIDMNREMIRIMLDGLGVVEVIDARDGREAMELLAKRPDIDVVLLDLQMPVMNGFETLERIKSFDSYRDIPVIVVTTEKSEVTRTLSMGANDFVAKPYNPEELKLRVRNHIRVKKLGELTRDMNVVLEGEVIKKTAALQRALDFSRKAEFEISLRLGRAAEFRDLETGMHIRRISELSKSLALLAGMSAENSEILRHAAPLHDVGKIGIPDRILLKPDKLDEAEFQIMKMHTTIGGTILSEADEFPVITAARIVALQHHEKWDGSGYPHGLSGTGIHIFGRIVMIADIFDALTSGRPYKKAFPIEKAVDIMKKGNGEFIDPTLFELFLGNLDVFLRIKEEFRDEKELSATEENYVRPLHYLLETPVV